MTNFSSFKVPYTADKHYSKKVAYFSMEFAVHQPLKIYSGGLGFLSGSHLRSAYELKQNLIGIGILWKYGYYDQSRNQDQTLQVQWNEKVYNFLKDTGIKFQIIIHDAPVWVKVGNSRYAVGVHTNGLVSGNSATRIVQPVFNNIQAWKNLGM